MRVERTLFAGRSGFFTLVGFTWISLSCSDTGSMAPEARASLEGKESALELDREAITWAGIILTVEALGGRANVDLSGGEGSTTISVLPPRGSDQANVTLGSDPICETTAEEGLEGLGLEGLAECAREGSERDDCGNGGGLFRLEVKTGEAYVRLHCPTE